VFYFSIKLKVFREKDMAGLQRLLDDPTVDLNLPLKVDERVFFLFLSVSSLATFVLFFFFCQAPPLIYCLYDEIDWPEGAKALLARKDDRKLNVNAVDKYVCPSFFLFFPLFLHLLFSLTPISQSFFFLNFQSYTALLTAADTGYSELVRLLIAAGADLNVKSICVKTRFVPLLFELMKDFFCCSWIPL
jgi:hypothetical protein